MSASSNRRIKYLSVAKPIVYGNSAQKLDENSKSVSIPQEHTHLWTVFVKSPTVNGDADLTKFIKKVIFKLHDTYKNPIRTIESPPFQVTESGWGEFEINIKIVFHDGSSEKIVSFYHHLRLHSYYLIPITDQKQLKEFPDQQFKTHKIEEKEGEKIHIDEDKNELSSSFFDEIVFNEPYIDFFQHCLLNTNILPKQKDSKQGVPPFSTELELEELHRMDESMAEIDTKITQYKERLMQLQKQQIDATASIVQGTQK